MMLYASSVRHESISVPGLRVSTTSQGAGWAIAREIKEQWSTLLGLQSDPFVGDEMRDAIASAMELGHAYANGFYITVARIEVAPEPTCTSATPARGPQGLPVPLALGQMEDLARRTRDLSSVLEGILREERARRGGHDPEA